MFSEPVGSLPLYTILIASHLLNPPYVCLEKPRERFELSTSSLQRSCSAKLSYLGPTPYNYLVSEPVKDTGLPLTARRLVMTVIFVLDVITTAVGIFVSIAIGDSSD